MSRPPLPDYPWDMMVPFRERAAMHADGFIDLSVGSPVDPTPDVVREALAVDSDAHGYPVTSGKKEVAQAIVDWFARRRGVTGLSSANVLPTIGSKEMVALLPFFLGLGPGDVVVHPQAAYPSYAMGALMVQAEALACDHPDEWPDTARLVWINSPGNPDGRVLDAEELARAVVRAREIGAVLASDECYAALGWESPWDRQIIPSVLDPRVVGNNYGGVLALYSLSKQSNMAGYRTALVAGDAELIASLLTVRKHAGLMMPAPQQSAMIAALNDDDHVDRQRKLYSERRTMLKSACEAAGFRIDRSEAGLYLWVSERRDGWETIARLADVGILAGPGSFYGHFPHHVRMAITAPTDQIAEAATRLRHLSQ